MLLNLNENGTYIQVGPASIVVTVKKNGKNLKKAEVESAERLKKILVDLSNFRDALKIKAYKLNIKGKKVPDVVRKTIEAAKLIDKHELTPMSAVAGAVSESLLKWIKQNFDCDKIIVNNGGDIAIDFKKEIKLLVSDNLKLTIKSTKVKGVATSGLGGRSLTKGIADFVTVFSTSSSIADAAATYIANNVFVKSNKIEFCYAHEIDEDTDLKGELVVKNVGNLDTGEIDKAVENGIKTAEKLMEQKKILGAIVKKGSLIRYTSNIKDFLKI